MRFCPAILALALAFSPPALADEVDDDGWRPVITAHQTQAGTRATTPDAVLNQAANVVYVRCPAQGAGSAGSGTYLGNGLVLTAWHVVEDSPRATCGIRFPLGRQNGQDLTETITATVISGDANLDSAILRLSAAPSRATGVPVSVRTPGRGDQLTAAGYSTGRLIFFPGHYLEHYSGGKWFEMSNWAISGDSGGPVFYADGTLAGNLWGSDGRNTIAVNTNHLLNFLEPYAKEVML